jgi:hypothetical protein
VPGLRERPAWAAGRVRWYTGLERAPRLYCAYLRRRGVTTVVDARTTIVIDGAPGSANSFAREAFLFANPDAIVASHIHSAAHVIEGLRLGTPTVLTIREPVDAISSYLARGYSAEITDALRAYERLHRRVSPALDRLVIAPFDRVTQAFGTVVDEVNARFGTHFVPFLDDDAVARDAVIDTLERYTREIAGGHAPNLQATPTAARRARTIDVRAALLEPEHRARLRRCETLYAECLACATLR